MLRLLVHLTALVVGAVLVPAAFADGWLPHSPHASWTYSWEDSVYSPTPTREKVTVQQGSADAFVLAWTAGSGKASSTGTFGATTPTGSPAVTGNGTVSFQQTSLGLDTTNWSGSPPPAAFPVLCAQASQCGNSLASFYFNVIWGSRQPTFVEPLIVGTSWASTGGFQNDVAGISDYLGTTLVKVPAFPRPVRAAVVRTDITQVGAIGDPYGSGVRTVWWVYGVGPVKLLFQHEGSGATAPVTSGELLSTNLKPEAPPSDADYFPLRVGLKGTFRWTNARHLKSAEVQSFKVDQVTNGSARISVSAVSGPLRVKGAYYYTLRADGLSNIAGASSAASLVTLPPLGPSSLPPARRRHFFTVFDLMEFGFNPVIPADDRPGATWSSHTGTRDFDVYGVIGTSRIMGIDRVTVPAGTFRALVVRTTLKQPGFPWGSGVRTAWFAPGKGLVKLVFRHGDGSVSEVDRLT